MQFEFATATRIVFGTGTISQLPAIAQNFGRRALVVTGRNPQRAEKLMAKHGGIHTTICSVDGEPEISTVENGVALAKKEKCDFVISLGGGSAIDAGKAIAAMMTNEGAVMEYLELIGRGKSLSNPSAPFIAIPTTAGTGSEVTRNSVLASTEHKLKVSLRSLFMLPRVAIVDPELTCDLPPALTASTGLDALTQLIEPFVCSRANPMTDGICVEGISRAAWALRAAFKNGGDIKAREAMAVASLFGGLALANAGLGAVHGFAGPIGGSFSAPHGAICAALLPHIMDANLQALREREPKNPAVARYERIAKLLTGNSNAMARDGVKWVRELTEDMQIQPLRVYGVEEKHVPDLVTKAANASSMKANPVTLTANELSAVLRAAL
ncbi:MAG TPA: iron-containing alcohol dehydrogenase [Verrucomicrobiae bacterium]|nr:iron-containing alcohol dehydrogenase [Verrucomicrobiae bacterium]